MDNKNITGTALGKLDESIKQAHMLLGKVSVSVIPPEYNLSNTKSLDLWWSSLYFFLNSNGPQLEVLSEINLAIVRIVGIVEKYYRKEVSDLGLKNGKIWIRWLGVGWKGKGG